MSKKTKKLGKSQSRRKAGRRNLSNRNKRANRLDPTRSKKRGSRFKTGGAS